jgi:hypothetical protein
VAKGYAADSNGTVAISFAMNGHYTLIISATGYEEKQMKITIPYTSCLWYPKAN